MATCPECEYDEIDLDELEEGDTTSCPECGTLLVKTGTDEIDFADDEDDLDADDDEEGEEEGDDFEDDEDEEETEDEDWEE